VGVGNSIVSLSSRQPDNGCGINGCGRQEAASIAVGEFPVSERAINWATGVRWLEQGDRVPAGVNIRR
jgi:hypothetical protein